MNYKIKKEHKNDTKIKNKFDWTSILKKQSLNRNTFFINANDSSILKEDIN